MNYSKFSTEIRVIYGDTDAMGMAYYGQYFRWFETGRNEWLRRTGVTYKEIEEMGVFAPVTQAYCHYLNPARYDDIIIVETTIEYLKRASIKFLYRIVRKEDMMELVRGYTIHAFTDNKGKIVRTPEILKEKVGLQNL
jgi:acyl-CoA thioester hydrolase